MNNAKMWLVVKPTVGIPLFLTAVAVGSFAVHVAVLSNTTWVADFLSGKGLNAGASAAVTVPADGVAKVAYIPGKNDVLVKLPDGTMAYVTIQTPEELASAAVPLGTISQ
jgi:light-harvesting protein B-800-850 alpha chain